MIEAAYKLLVDHSKVALDECKKDLDELRARLDFGHRGRISMKEYTEYTEAVYTRQSILLNKLQKLILEGPKEGTRWDKLIQE